MNIYIWRYIAQCTDSFHSEGGVVGVAETEERARELANALDGCAIKAEEKPDAVYRVSDGVAEAVYRFPNAGCC